MNKNGKTSPIVLHENQRFLNRDLSWLSFASRVLKQVKEPELPLLERIKFASIIGMLHDEFLMKRVSNLKALIQQNKHKTAHDGVTPLQVLNACRGKIQRQINALANEVNENLLPELKKAGIPIMNYEELNTTQKKYLRDYFCESVHPIIIPLAVDAEHPFPFISNKSLNLAVQVCDSHDNCKRFVKIEVPTNRPRWIPLPQNRGYVPLEQVMIANLDQVFPSAEILEAYPFRVIRAVEGETSSVSEYPENLVDEPGSLIHQVTNELIARRFAGVVALQVEKTFPEELRVWLAEQLNLELEDIYTTESLLNLNDLSSINVENIQHLSYPPHKPQPHSRLKDLDSEDTEAIFQEIKKGDILLHHPYHCFDTSTLKFIQSAALDPHVLAIKISIYRTHKQSLIVEALAEAARRGKQVVVLVEVTARFDEAPNIAWSQYLKKEGVHVAYGVEKLKTHVKIALVVREEGGKICRYLHIGTGNYHRGTARVYEDLGLLTCNKKLCADVGDLFNQLTGALPNTQYRKLVVAPYNMRNHFIKLIRREAGHARAGRPSGIRAKMNQLEDPAIIEELYKASRAGVPISLNVRGLCCLRPGVPGLSENIKVFSVVGRFLEHCRIYEFVNGGSPEYFIGSADWMRRNLDRRVEAIAPILDNSIKKELNAILTVYEHDNSTVWDCMPDGSYIRRTPSNGKKISAQQIFIETVNQDPIPLLSQK